MTLDLKFIKLTNNILDDSRHNELIPAQKKTQLKKMKKKWGDQLRYHKHVNGARLPKGVLGEKAAGALKMKQNQWFLLLIFASRDFEQSIHIKNNIIMIPLKNSRKSSRTSPRQFLSSKTRGRQQIRGQLLDRYRSILSRISGHGAQFILER